MTLVAGVDSSTQSTKVEIRDADSGILVSSGRAPHPPARQGRQGQSEADPADWWQAVRVAFRQALTGADADDVAAVAVAGQQHGLVALGDRGEVIRPAKLWNDTESAPQAQRLRESLGDEWWAKRVGSVPVASFTITKLAWLAEHEPANFEQIARVVLPHDWLTHRLSGGFATDRGEASGTGYWSPASGTWAQDLLDDLVPVRGGWEHRLPLVHEPSEPAGDLQQSGSAATGLRPRTLVGPGTGDNMAAALGAGLQLGDVALSLGTSGTVYSVTTRPTADSSGQVAGFADASGRFLPLVCTLNATQVTNLVAGWLGTSRDDLSALALRAPPGASGTILLPYLAGERTPNLPDATGALAGLSTVTTRADIARAAYEGVVCGLLDGLDALVAAGVDTQGGRLFLVGGGSRSEAYRRIVADLSGRAVVVPAGDEHVATGACMQAAAVLDSADPAEISAAWTAGQDITIEPTPVDRAGIRGRYAEARQAAIDRLSPG